MYLRALRLSFIKFHPQSANLLVEITLQFLFLLQKNDNLSTHEKQLEKIRSEIEQMEKANLDPKTWIMQGEVTLCFVKILLLCTV